MDLYGYPSVKWTEIGRNSFTGDIDYNIETRISFKEKKTGTTIADFYDNHGAHYSPTGGTKALKALEGASLFLLAPITSPLATQAIGSEAEKLIKEHITRSIRNIGDQIIGDVNIRKYAELGKKSKNFDGSRAAEASEKESVAIQMYKQQLLSDPSNYMAHVNLGSEYKNSGRINDAIFEYEKAIILKPKDPLAYVGLGVLYFSLARKYVNNGQVENGNIELNKAINQYKKAAELEPGNPSFLYTLGTMYDLRKDGSDAIISTKKAEKLFLAKGDLKGAADCKRSLREYFNRYNFEPEDFEGAAVALAPELSRSDSRHHQRPQPVLGGTGFLFSSKDYIITNYHVVKGANSIQVKFPGGEVIEADLQAKDNQNDIALLKLARSPSVQIPELQFGDSSKVRPGDKVFTIGYPASSILGKNQKITDGIISAVTGIEDDPTMFQITVPIQPGNSGGPLFNEKGEVIGITTASLSLNAVKSLGANPQNINYAVKASFVNNLLGTIPKTLLSNRGIVVVPKDNSLSNFFEQVSSNIVLIEAK